MLLNLSNRDHYYSFYSKWFCLCLYLKKCGLAVNGFVLFYKIILQNKHFKKNLFVLCFWVRIDQHNRNLMCQIYLSQYFVKIDKRQLLQDDFGNRLISCRRKISNSSSGLGLSQRLNMMITFPRTS